VFGEPVVVEDREDQGLVKGFTVRHLQSKENVNCKNMARGGNTVAEHLVNSLVVSRNLWLILFSKIEIGVPPNQKSKQSKVTNTSVYEHWVGLASNY